jgi:hypothetical protein
VNRADGVTRALVAPGAGKSIFAGQGAVIDTGADMEPVTAARTFQFVELGETGAAAAGGSRSSAFALFRNALREATQLRRYAAPVQAPRNATPDQREQPVVRDPNESRLYNGQRNQDVLLTRYDAAALVPVLQGRQYLFVHVERARDILNVLGLGREFSGLKLVLVGASEGWLVADRIAKSGVPVIASAVNDLPASFEQIAATQSNVGRMRAAGVKVSIGMIDDNDTRNLFMERQYAGNLVGLQKIPGATGVGWGEALAMITSRPAEAIGMGSEIGSLAAGRRADPSKGPARPSRSSSMACGSRSRPTRRGFYAAIGTSAGATCPRRTGIDAPGRPFPVLHRVPGDALPDVAPAARSPGPGNGRRAVPRSLFAHCADHLRSDDLFLPRDRA